MIFAKLSFCFAVLLLLCAPVAHAQAPVIQDKDQDQLTKLQTDEGDVKVLLDSIKIVKDGYKDVFVVSIPDKDGNTKTLLILTKKQFQGYLVAKARTEKWPSLEVLEKADEEARGALNNRKMMLDALLKEEKDALIALHQIQDQLDSIKNKPAQLPTAVAKLIFVSQSSDSSTAAGWAKWETGESTATVTMPAYTATYTVQAPESINKDGSTAIKIKISVKTQNTRFNAVATLKGEVDFSPDSSVSALAETNLSFEKEFTVNVTARDYSSDRQTLEIRVSLQDGPSFIYKYRVVN